MNIYIGDKFYNILVLNVHVVYLQGESDMEIMIFEVSKLFWCIQNKDKDGFLTKKKGMIRYTIDILDRC